MHLFLNLFLGILWFWDAGVQMMIVLVVLQLFITIVEKMISVQ